jgi:cytochrome P450
MTKLDQRDYFTDHEMLVDPYAYFEAIRQHGPVYLLKDRNIMFVTGFEECREVLMDEELYSAIIASAGPATPLPFTPEGDDVNEQLEAHRHLMPLYDMVTSMDGQQHHNARGLLNKLFLPSRLKANEAYMADLANRMCDQVIAKGGCEMISEIATPFVTLVIADLLGVPEEDRQMFRDALAETPPLFDIDNAETGMARSNGYLEMGEVFYRYILDRRANPRDDILTQIATETFPDGTSPDPAELVKVVMTLFGAGQDTSAKLLANSTRFLCENPEMQDRLRKDPDMIVLFLHEMMRIEGSVKMTSRMATRKTTLGGVEIPAGQVMAVVVAAANRDPRRFDDPQEFKLNRSKIAEHLGFGRGSHTCIGAPLARAEVRVFLERLLAKTSSITLSEKHHGKRGARTLKYEPSYGMRGLAELYVDLTPA